MKWLGIDFSGNVLKWRPREREPNVWVAEVQEADGALALASLRSAQNIAEGGAPFESMVKLLVAGSFDAAAIDASFSIPTAILGGRPHSALLALVHTADTAGRPFLDGEEFILRVSGSTPPLQPPKPLRRTEEYWQAKGLNVRSTMWHQPRGGAPMTSACLTLLLKAGRPIWPFQNERAGVLVEAFPAAQLLHWGLPFQKYADHEEGSVRNRQAIVTALGKKLSLGLFKECLVDSPDAIDAVLCAFAARAALLQQIACQPEESASVEGWIAVHR